MVVFFFFFKQKTAYEMRISDWSSDVCSSDLQGHPDRANPVLKGGWASRNTIRLHVISTADPAAFTNLKAHSRLITLLEQACVDQRNRAGSSSSSRTTATSRKWWANTWKAAASRSITPPPVSTAIASRPKTPRPEEQT